MSNSLDDSSSLNNEDEVYPSSPRPRSPEVTTIELPFAAIKNLPWKPKVRQSDIETFLDQERKKFLGYGDLHNDLDTLIGLPIPIHESVRILKQVTLISLEKEFLYLLLFF